MWIVLIIAGLGSFLMFSGMYLQAIAFLLFCFVLRAFIKDD